MKRLLKNWEVRIGGTLVGIFLLVTVFAPVLTPYRPNEIDMRPQVQLQAPSWQHPMGTDQFGRDILTRVLYGSRISVTIALIVVFLATVWGTFYGGVAGFFGHQIDFVLMRIVDFMLSIPIIFLYIFVASFWGNNLVLLILLLSGTSWMGISRLVRAEVLSIKKAPFVEAAFLLNIPRWKIFFRHVLFNSLTPVLVAATMKVGIIVLVESTLSFIGLGVQPPTPSWGNMIAEGKDFLLDGWWMSFFPGLAIVSLVVSINLLGDGLQRIFHLHAR
ncbi:MAG: ABC transporter permease [Calditrichaeota bacterium]|nr:ABC transporter permease [Calditrichota bacterium]